MMNSLKRFLFGLAVGLFCAAIAWSYTLFFHVSLPLWQGVLGSLFLAIVCGIITTVGGLDKLMDNLPLF